MLKTTKHYQEYNTDLRTLYEIVFGFYILIFVFCLSKILKNVKYLRISSNIKVFIIDMLVLLMCLSIVYLVRIFWASRVFGYMNNSSFTLLGELASSALNLISATFVLLWVELYTNLNFLILCQTRSRIWKLAVVIFIIFVICELAFHIWICFQSIGGINKYTLDLYVDIGISVVQIISIVSVSWASLKIAKLVFSEDFSQKISKKLSIIAAINVSVYLIRIFFALFDAFSLGKTSSNLIIFEFFYFLCGEIIPLFSIIVFFYPEKNTDANSSLVPSFLLKEDVPSQNVSFLKLIGKNTFVRAGFGNKTGEISGEQDRKRSELTPDQEFLILINQSGKIVP